MPLLNKHKWERDPPPKPEDFSHDTMVIYLDQTNEMFLDHGEFFKRMMHLNSTVWTCAQTRKSHLTFYEASKSESEAEKDLQDFPEFLELPILFIVHTYTNRGRFEDVVSDVYCILKDRFFTNEECSYSEKGKKFHVRIVASYTTHGGQIDENLEEEGDQQMMTEVKEPVVQAPEVYRYTVEILGIGIAEEEKYREDVTCEKLFRSKVFGARQKIRLFLKNSCHLAPDSDRYTIRDELLPKVANMRWLDVMSGQQPICPQTPVQQRGRIPNVLKSGFVDGVEGSGGTEKRKEKRQKKEEKDPNSTPRPRGRPPQTPEQRAVKLKEKQDRKRESGGKDSDAHDFDLTQSGALTMSPAKKKIRRNSTKNEKKKAKIQEQQEDLDFYFTEARRLGISVEGLSQEDKLISPKKVAEFKQRVREQKDVEREQQKEEKRRKIREKAAYNKKREDLLCDDSKPMPKLPALELPPWMTAQDFGDFIFIQQFFSSFKEILPLKEIRGTDELFSFSEIVLSIRCNDPQNSPFADLMRVLLSIRTDICDEEDGDEADCNNKEESYLINTQNCDPVNGQHGEMIRDIGDLHHRIRKIHGKSVRHLPVDWMTLTEVLRLIFETSGYYTGISTHRHRLYARGNFRGYEDPAYEFKINHPGIMEKLKTLTVFDLEPTERMEIVKSIIYQLLTYSKFRAHLEKVQSELTELKREQKRLKTWDVGQEGEANAARLLLELDTNGVVEKQENLVAKRLKQHLKAHVEGRRYDREDLNKILLETIPFGHLTLDEIVTSRDLQKLEFKTLMDTVTEKLFQAYCKASDVRLGSDRAYRRYLVMDNLSAILVENPRCEELQIHCDEATPTDGISAVSNGMTADPAADSFICTGSVSTCQVHGTARDLRPHWEYIPSKTLLEQLLTSLNPRGNREVELTEQLVEYKPNLLEILEDTEFLLQGGTWETLLMTKESDPADTYNIDWDQEIRDLLLDFEEKLDQGLMGSVQKMFHVSRETWRATLKSSGDVTQFLAGSLVDVTEHELPRSEEMSDAKKLAVAFFMIIRSISLKFIKPPYISPNRDEHGHLKPSELFNRWQKALLQIDSHSALSLFITTFESSIKWDRSRLQGKCKSCRRKATAHELVLCSECDSCYHLTCAKLSTQSDPPRDWMCQTCRAQARKAENEQKRRAQTAPDHIQMTQMSIDDDTLPYPENTVFKTASGRSVKKIQYSEVHEGPSLKNRKSNGNTPSTSDRPQRMVQSSRIFDMDNENGLTDDDSDNDSPNSDGENTRKRKIPSKKSLNSLSDSPRVITASSTTPITNKTKQKMGEIEQLLKETMRQECSWPFLQPVDAKEVPDYYDVIKRPMDLRTMMNKIKQRIYNKPGEIRSDFHLILTNCETYNETESEIYQLSQQLDAFVSNRLDAIIDQ